MWIGVTIGFAGMKLSGSIKIKGFNRFTIINKKIIRVALVMSFIEK
jgi:hypothetical protein